MDEINDDNQKKMEASEDQPIDSTGGGGSSRPEEDEPPSEDAVAAAAQSPRPVSQTSGSTVPADPSPETKEEDTEHLTKAKLLEYGRKFAKMRKESRLKARARAEQEKIKGLLTMTLKGHKDHRRLVMVFGTKLIITLDHMREANLNPGPLEEGLTKFLEDYYKAHVGPHVKKKR